MPKIADAYVELDARTGKYLLHLSQAKRSTTSFGKSATKSLKRIGIGLAAVAAAAAAAAVAIGIKLARAFIRMGASAVKTAVKFDKLKRGLAAVVGGTDKAARQLIRLRKVAELPGLSFEAAIQGSINLQAAGIEAQLAERALKAFGNALVTVGKGAEDLAGVNLALTQIANKTSGFGQDVRQLQERLPQMQTALKNAFGGKPLEDLQITGKELVAALVAEFEKLPRAAGGIANTIENIGIEFELLKATIGEALIPAVDESLKSLTSITTKLTQVIKHYKDFRDEAATVFRQIAVIGIKLTTELTVGMAKILAKAAKIIWVPLKFEVLRTMQGVNDAVEIGIIKMMGTVREFFGGDAEIARLQIQTVKTSRIAWDLLFNQIRNADFDKAIRENLAGIEKDLAAAFASITKAFADADAALDPLVAKLPKVGDGAEEATRGVFAFNKAVGKLNLSFADLSGFAKTFSQFRLEQFGSKLAAAFQNAGKMSDALKVKLKALADHQIEQAQKVIDTIAPAFENLFSNLFSGNTKSLWEQFWSDLKQIAIRQISQIAAAQVLSGLFGGGAKAAGGGGGFGPFLSSFAPLLTAINPALGGLAFVGGKAAGFLEQPSGRNTINNFYQTDFANLDSTRIQKTVSQTILPSLEEERTDGR